jgi:hypothetical protein
MSEYLTQEHLDRLWAYLERAWDLDRLLEETEQQASQFETEDAKTVLAWIQALRGRVNGETRDDVTLALKLGALAEKLGFSILEPYAIQAWKAKEALVRDAKARGHSPEEKQAALAEFDRLREENPFLGIGAIDRRVHKKTGVPLRTLRRWRSNRNS